MSLRYIIDGYNIINHPAFTPNNKKPSHPAVLLLDFIKIHNPCGSSRNKVSVVFDGYPPGGTSLKDNYPVIEIIFSKDQSADETIKLMVEKSTNPKVIIVVSDDREVKSAAGSAGSGIMSVEEFVSHSFQKSSREVFLKPELKPIQINQINKELKKLWLK